MHEAPDTGSDHPAITGIGSVTAVGTGRDAFLKGPRATRSAIRRATFGDAASCDVAVSGSRAYHGHALGASGAMEVAITCLAFEDDWVHP